MTRRISILPWLFLTLGLGLALWGASVEADRTESTTVSATDESRTRPRVRSHGPGGAPAGRHLKGR